MDRFLGNQKLLDLPKTAFLSSRRIEPAAVMRCSSATAGFSPTPKIASSATSRPAATSNWRCRNFRS